MDLKDVRVNIDRVDSEIKALFKERMTLADQVATIKAATSDDIYKPDREESIISTLTDDVNDDIKKEYTALVKRIMEVSRKYQYGRTFDFRDPLADVPYVTDVSAPAKLLMKREELYICQGYSKDSVTVVKSYGAMADAILSQDNVCGMGILEEVSYGVSDELHDILANSGLHIFKCDIVEDEGKLKKVVTFGKDLVVNEDHNRLKFMFVCKDKSGSLSSVLSMISDYGVNLTEIHSMPYRDKGGAWNYRFFLELEGNFLTRETRALVFQLRSETEEFKVLGSYKVE